MTYRGHIENGVVVMDEDCPIPEGVRVKVELEDNEVSHPHEALSEGLLRLAGTIKDMPADMSQNLDHYLYGSPKK